MDRPPEASSPINAAEEERHNQKPTDHYPKCAKQSRCVLHARGATAVYDERAIQHLASGRRRARLFSCRLLVCRRRQIPHEGTGPSAQAKGQHNTLLLGNNHSVLKEPLDDRRLAKNRLSLSRSFVKNFDLQSKELFCG